MTIVRVVLKLRARRVDGTGMETFASEFACARSRVSQPVRRLALGVLGFGALVAVGALALPSALNAGPEWVQAQSAGARVQGVLSALGVAACFGAAALLARAQLLRLATARAGGASNLRTRDALRADAEASLVGLCAWPGFVLGDAYRAAVVGCECADARGMARVLAGVKSIVKFRIALALGVAGTLLAASMLLNTWLLGLAMIACGTVLLATRGIRSASMNDAHVFAGLPRLAAWGTLSVGLRVLGACAAGWMLLGLAPLELAPLLLVVTLLGLTSLAASGLTLGLAGVGAFAALTQVLAVPVHVAAVVVLVGRLGLDGPGVALGAAGLALRAARGMLAAWQLRSTAIETMRREQRMTDTTMSEAESKDAVGADAGLVAVVRGEPGVIMQHVPAPMPSGNAIATELKPEGLAPTDPKV